ncbi:hypothetical protein J4Q44_G00140630, partial [Coregonus suidteri]
LILNLTHTHTHTSHCGRTHILNSPSTGRVPRAEDSAVHQWGICSGQSRPASYASGTNQGTRRRTPSFMLHCIK